MKTNNLLKLIWVLLLPMALILTSCDDDQVLPAITTNIESGTLDFGSVERGKGNVKTFVVSTVGISADIELALSGKGYSIDKTTIPANSNKNTVSITFFRPLDAPEGAYTGSVTISSGGAKYTLGLSATIGELRLGEFGFFVVNEGAFRGGNASISYFNKITGTMTNGVFSTKNTSPLGDQAQSMTVAGGFGYVVVQNSKKIEVINASDFSSVATITEGITSPRYMVALNEQKGYISDWGTDGKSGTVKVLNLATRTVTKSIETGQGANKMVIVNDKLYVTNAGGWGIDNTIQVIDTNTDAIVKTIEVGDKPSSIVADDNGTIWVTGGGKVVYSEWPNIDLDASTAGFIAKIVGDAVEVSFSMPKIGAGPSGLEINSTGKDIYFSYDGSVYTMKTEGVGAGSTADIKPFINKSFYGIDLDPSTDNILGFESPNFTSVGTMYRYDSKGTQIDSYEVGIGPNGAGL